ncbi:hypothetical protein ACFLW8_02670 [Chloroflexota bacterium]
MEDPVIKSALEIAMEKIARMQKLTSEEIIEQQEREYKPRGEAITGKYMGSMLKAADLDTGLDKYHSAEREIVKKAILSSLVQSISLENNEKSQRAIAGMIMLAPKVDLEEISTEVSAILAEFLQEKDRKYIMYEAAEQEKLRRLGISGSAIKAKLNGTQDWQNVLQETHQIYDLRLTNIKGKLSRHIGSQMPQ